jgi:hypothetical protein
MGFPNLPGVPALSKLNPNVVAGAVTLASPGINSLLDLLKPAWGIYPSTAKKFDEKSKAIRPDSFLSVMYHNESNLPMFPIENGAFGTYNKVPTPYDITIRVAKSNTLGLNAILGGADKMSDFLKTIEKMLADVKLYNIVTPDYTYINANLKGYDYKREMNNGAAIIIADLHFVEIMRASVAVTSAIASDGGKSTSASASVDNGVCTASNPSGIQSLIPKI